MAPEHSVKGRDTAMGCSLRDSSSLMMENRGEEATEAFPSREASRSQGSAGSLGGIQTAQNVLSGALLEGPQGTP